LVKCVNRVRGSGNMANTVDGPEDVLAGIDLQGLSIGAAAETIGAAAETENINDMEEGEMLDAFYGTGVTPSAQVNRLLGESKKQGAVPVTAPSHAERDSKSSRRRNVNHDGFQGQPEQNSSAKRAANTNLNIRQMCWVLLIIAAGAAGWLFKELTSDQNMWSVTNLDIDQATGCDGKQPCPRCGLSKDGVVSFTFSGHSLSCKTGPMGCRDWWAQNDMIFVGQCMAATSGKPVAPAVPQQTEIPVPAETPRSAPAPPPVANRSKSLSMALPWASRYSQRYIPGSNGTFAQNYQDIWAVAVARRNGWPSTAQGEASGFFLDLGAFHGLECSNSALLEKQFGWRGICVEPMPYGFEHRSCVVVARPLSNEADKPVRFFGKPWSQIRHIGRQPGDPMDMPDEEIKTMTISQLFDCVNLTNSSGGLTTSGDCTGVSGKLRIPQFIHFVSLDIEGQELNILSTWPWNRVQVGIWVIEQTDDPSRPGNQREETRKVLQQHGYMKVPVENPGIDEYFALPHLWESSLGKKDWRIHPKGSEC